MRSFAHGLCLVVLSVPFCNVAFAQRDLTLETVNQRRALVIGNDSYTKGPLNNAVNDARLMGATLGSLSFQVTLVNDAGSRQMEDAVNRFASSLSPGDVALFYYAGHGVQIDGENYLIPVDFTGHDEADVRYSSRSASWVLDKIARAGARLQIVVLDACRTDPFRATRAVGGGLAQMQGGRGSFIAFATAAGSIADDNPSAGHGLFTNQLVHALNLPGLSLDEVFNRVRVEVDRESASRQLPFIYSGVIGEFYFHPATTNAAASPASSTAIDAEVVYWNSMKDTRDVALFESYLKRYPAGQFAEIAEARLAELRPAVRAAAPKAVPAAAPGADVQKLFSSAEPSVPPEITENGITFFWHHDHGRYKGPEGKLHVEKNLITWKENLTQQSATSEHNFSATCSELKWKRVENYPPSTSDLFIQVAVEYRPPSIDLFIEGKRFRFLVTRTHEQFLKALEKYCSY